jgi:hypothetical protein
VPSDAEHDLTLRLFDQVASRLRTEEADRLRADLELIVDLLDLPPDADVERVASWIQHVHLS